MNCTIENVFEKHENNPPLMWIPILSRWMYLFKKWNKKMFLIDGR